MTFEEAVAHFGSQAKMARALNIKEASVTRWKTRRDGIIPIYSQLMIEKLSGGKLKANFDEFRKPGGKKQIKEK